MAGSMNNIKAGEAYVELGLKTNFGEGVRNAHAQLQGIGKQLQRMGSIGVSAGAAIAGSLASTILPATAMAAQMKDVADRTGMTVEQVSSLGFAAAETGSNLETLEAALQKVQEQAGRSNGADGFAQALDRIGLTVGELRAMNPEQRLKAIADGLQSIPGPAERSAIAVQLMGEQARKLGPLMAEGSDGIQKLQEQAKKLGIELSNQDAQTLDELGKSIEKLGGSVLRLSVPIATALAPTLETMATNVTELTGELQEFLAENQEGIRLAFDYAVNLAKFGAALVAGGVALRGLLAIQAAWNTATKISIGLQIAIQSLGGPAAWAKLAIGIGVATAASYAMYTALDKMEDKLRSTGEAAKETNEQTKKTFSAPVTPPTYTMSDAPVNEQEARSVFEAGLSGSERMAQSLDRLKTLWHRFGDTVNDPQVREGFKTLFEGAVDQQTGIITAIQRVTDEIERMSGAATEAQQELRRMADAGAPPELLERYRQLIEYRDRLATEQQQQQDQQAAADKFQTDMQARADQLKKQAMTPQERANAEIREADQLLQLGFMDPETYKRTLERIKESMAGSMPTQEHRNTLTATYSGIEAARSAGLTIQERLLDEARKQTENTKKTAENTEKQFRFH